jgi:hypothetical protein
LVARGAGRYAWRAAPKCFTMRTARFGLLPCDMVKIVRESEAERQFIGLGEHLVQTQVPDLTGVDRSYSF